MSDEPFDLVLLKIEPDAYPLYLVVKALRMEGYTSDDHTAHFYESHSCPANWMPDVLAVISGGGDDDPHGFATFVKRIQAPDGMDEFGDIDGDCNTPWTQIFPEAG